MKEQDFKIPFSWEERKPYLMDHLLYIPSYYEKHGLANFSLKGFFNNEQDTHVEYCSGNGEWILEKAQNNPNINWVAVEKRFDRARKIWAKTHNMHLKNLLVVLGEAYVFSKYYLADSVIKESYINFPDPWPKNTHKKHRLISITFLAELSRVITKGGKITVVTDDITYADALCKCFLESDWTPLFEKPHYVENLTTFGTSYFARLWESQGKNIRYFIFSNLAKSKAIKKPLHIA